MKVTKQIYITIFAGLLFATSACSSDGTNSNSNQTAELQAEQLRLEAQKLELQKQEQERAEQQRIAFKASITSLLQADARLGNISNGDCTSQASAMRDLDLSQCPSDFAIAYVDHIHAWEYAAKIQRARKKLNSDDNVGDVLISEGLNDIFGTGSHPLRDALEADTELKKLAGEASDKIKETFNVVERIATSYGASLPH